MADETKREGESIYRNSRSVHKKSLIVTSFLPVLLALDLALGFTGLVFLGLDALTGHSFDSLRFFGFLGRGSRLLLGLLDWGGFGLLLLGVLEAASLGLAAFWRGPPS